MKVDVDGNPLRNGPWIYTSTPDGSVNPWYRKQFEQHHLGDKSVDKIEMGKQYRTRDGMPVRIYAVDCGGDFPVHGAVALWGTRAWTILGISEISKVDDLFEIPPEPQYRPFTSEELLRIVGRHVRRKANPGESMIVTWAKVTGFVVAGQFSVCREALLRDWQFIDFDANGKEIVTPCGVVVEATP